MQEPRAKGDPTGDASDAFQAMARLLDIDGVGLRKAVMG